MAARLPAFPLSPALVVHPPPGQACSGTRTKSTGVRPAPWPGTLPAYLVVNRQHDVLRFSGQTGKYLEPATGVASLNLFTLLHPDLRAIVRVALKRAASDP